MFSEHATYIIDSGWKVSAYEYAGYSLRHVRCSPRVQLRQAGVISCQVKFDKARRFASHYVMCIDRERQGGGGTNSDLTPSEAERMPSSGDENGVLGEGGGRDSSRLGG